LTDNDGRHNYTHTHTQKLVSIASCAWRFLVQWLTLLSQFRLTLLDRSDNHITSTGSRESVQTTLNVADSDNVQVLGTTTEEKRKKSKKMSEFRRSSRCNDDEVPVFESTYELSLQFITAATGRPSVIRYLVPEMLTVRKKRFKWLMVKFLHTNFKFFHLDPSIQILSTKKLKSRNLFGRRFLWCNGWMDG
jgi:hypothetical protein